MKVKLRGTKSQRPLFFLLFILMVYSFLSSFDRFFFGENFLKTILCHGWLQWKLHKILYMLGGGIIAIVLKDSFKDKK